MPKVNRREMLKMLAMTMAVPVAKSVDDEKIQLVRLDLPVVKRVRGDGELIQISLKLDRQAYAALHAMISSGQLRIEVVG